MPQPLLTAALLAVPVFRRLGLGDLLGYPHVKFYALARDRAHVVALRERCAKVYIRDTLLSSLHIAEELLLGSGFSRSDARDTIEVFRKHDADTLNKQYAVRDDDDAVVATAKESIDQLEYLFDEDQRS